MPPTSCLLFLQIEREAGRKKGSEVNHKAARHHTGNYTNSVDEEEEEE